jgi:hypothetical protein
MCFVCELSIVGLDTRCKPKHWFSFWVLETLVFRIDRPVGVAQIEKRAIIFRCYRFVFWFHKKIELPNLIEREMDLIISYNRFWWLTSNTNQMD